MLDVSVPTFRLSDLFFRRRGEGSVVHTVYLNVSVISLSYGIVFVVDLWSSRCTKNCTHMGLLDSIRNGKLYYRANVYSRPIYYGLSTQKIDVSYFALGII